MSDVVHLRSAGAPNGVAEYVWADTDSVVAVELKVGHQLLAIRDGGYSVAEPYDARPPKAEKRITELPAQEIELQLVGNDDALAEGLDLVKATKEPRARKG